MGAAVRYIMPQRGSQLLAVVGEDLRVSGRLQVGLQELALPAIAVLKGKVRPVTVMACHTVQYRRTRGEDNQQP